MPQKKQGSIDFMLIYFFEHDLISKRNSKVLSLVTYLSADIESIVKKIIHSINSKFECLSSYLLYCLWLYFSQHSTYRDLFYKFVLKRLFHNRFYKFTSWCDKSRLFANNVILYKVWSYVLKFLLRRFL